MNTSIMLVLPSIFLLIACCTTLALGKCDIEKAKNILKQLKEMTKKPAKFDDSQMKLLNKNEFYLSILVCQLDEAKPLYKEHEEAFKNALQHYENECPQLLTKMKKIQNCRATLVPSKLFISGVAEFCREYDHCTHIYNNSCTGLRNLPLVKNILSIAATDVCKLECNAKDKLLNQLSNCWGFINTNTGKFITFYQCISSVQRQHCTITQRQALKMFPLFSHNLENVDTPPPSLDCVAKWRILEDLETWTHEICTQVNDSKDCIIKHLKDEEKKIRNKIHCNCSPSNKDFHKFNVLDPEHKISVISSSSGGVFDETRITQWLSSLMLLLVTRLTIQL